MNRGINPMGENERDPQADLALCEAATRGPWESVSGYSVREPEDERGYGPIIANMDCKEHSVEQMVHNTCFICESREALPWYIRAYLAQREEIERLQAEVERLRKIIDDATGHSKDGDGTDLLCKALYGRPGKVADWLGGSEARMLHDAAKEVDRLRAENERLRERSEEAALARLRAWRAAAFGRWFNLENDVGCPDCLVLGELQGGGHQASRLVTASSDDEPHTEDKPASLGEMVTAALREWERKYGEVKG